jgi:peptidoglycan/xylan/chitin deacetylase (PgdA/CDA1 family)
MRVALTFDAEHPDRPHSPPGNDERLLDVLAGEGVRATFFVQGRWVLARPDTARRIAAEGHLIGNHSHYHTRMRLLTAEGIRTDVLTAERAIRDVIGVDPRPWFRLPFGSGHTSARLAGLIGEMGYGNVGWDFDLFDWDEARSADLIEAAAVDGVLAAADDAIVLMHTWAENTPVALPRIIRRLRDEGAAFDTVDGWPEPPRTSVTTPNEGPGLTELLEERPR